MQLMCRLVGWKGRLRGRRKPSRGQLQLRIPVACNYGLVSVHSWLLGGIIVACGFGTNLAFQEAAGRRAPALSA